MLTVFLDALKDTAISLPFLFLAYLLMEFIEHKASKKMENSLKKIGKAGPLAGSALGCVPQCAFSASASNLYTAGVITEGTLIAVLLATSDEALPILISTPEAHSSIWKLILLKIVIGIIAGFTVDIMLKLAKIKKQEIELCEDCGCEDDGGILKPAIKHTLKIVLFILIVNILLGLVVYWVGDERIEQVLLSGSYAQPFITALVGLIPNCAISVLLTKLYIAGSISLGSAIAGLCSGAGVGLIVLWKVNPCKKENIRIMITLYSISAIFGFIIMLLGF